MTELPPNVESEHTEAGVNNQLKPSDSYENRTVRYIEKPDYFGPRTGALKTMRSQELSRINNPQLRCALRIADIMQALDFPEPEFGPVGGVTAIQNRNPNVAFGRFFTSEVTDEFPDDIMTQLSEKGTSNDS